LQTTRLKYKPALPNNLKDLSYINAVMGEATSPSENIDLIKKQFPKTFGQPIVSFHQGIEQKCHPIKIGVVLSGGQAPGGHNVIIDIFDAMRSLNSSSTLYGFLDGPDGIINNKAIVITNEIADNYPR